jgi:hypothetical protein
MITHANVCMMNMMNIALKEKYIYAGFKGMKQG